MKNETATRAVTMALLARSEWRPSGDLVFIAQADEENGEHEVGLKWLRNERADIRSDYAIDEGGGLHLELTDGRVVVPINVGEKATLPVRIVALGEAGHASTPTAGKNAVPLLAELVQRLARHRVAPALLDETRRTLEILVGDIGADLEGAIERAVTLHPSFPTSCLLCLAPPLRPRSFRGRTLLT